MSEQQPPEQDQQPDSNAASAGAGNEDQLGSLMTAWLASVGQRLQASAQLVMAETKLAVTTFLLMIFITILAAGALLFAWGLLVLVVARTLMLAGLPMLATFALLCVVHLGLAWGLWQLANRMGRHMEFNQTRRLLGQAAGLADDNTEQDQEDEHV